jgi:hypothetical protein
MTTREEEAFNKAVEEAERDLQGGADLKVPVLVELLRLLRGALTKEEKQ